MYTKLLVTDQPHRTRSITIEPEDGRVRVLVEANWMEGMSVELPVPQARELARAIVAVAASLESAKEAG